MLTYEDVKNNSAVRTYIQRADESLTALGYTEHSFAHVTAVAENAAYILSTLGYPERTVELAKIAGYFNVSVDHLLGKEEKPAAPKDGELVKDELIGFYGDTFSQEILGKGTAVIPSDGRVVAPADGLVTMVFDTKHAISMQTDNGAELIIHIGLDTVQLKGQYFDAHVAAGDKVKQGDLLLDFDIDKIKEAGYDVTTPVIICNTPQFPKMECVNGMEVRAGETAIIKL